MLSFLQELMEQQGRERIVIDGCEINPNDPAFLSQIKVAEKGMQIYYDTFHALAR